MIYIGLLILFSISLFLILYFPYKRKKVERKKLLESWAKKRIRYRNFYLIEKFYQNDNMESCYNLTEQTLIDIDIEGLFSIIDRTETTIGQQYLYSKLIKPSLSIDELNSRKHSFDYFIKNESKRIETKIVLHKLEKSETNFIADLFSPTINVKKGKYAIYLRILSFFAIISPFAFYFYPPIAIIMIFLFGINLMIHLIFRHNNNSKLKTIRQVFRLLKAVDKLETFALPINNKDIQNAKGGLNKFRNIYHFLDFGIPLNDISSIVFYILDLIKAFFLTEVHLLNFSYNELIKNKDALKAFFVYVGQIEMALCSASLKSDEDFTTCVPNSLNEDKVIMFEDITHPLVANCSSNSLTLTQKSAFITGSNMSGKSTFLRSVLINSILAQTLYLCFAKRFQLPIIKTFSSIKIADNLQAGTSYYFEEVNIIHEMVLHSNDKIKNLFIIDEIFKGTNSVERIALSKAILHYLNNNENIVIASSHDIELIKLLNNEFGQYHFTESVFDNQLHFDHKIQLGPLKTRNAIKIIEIEQFPPAIIEDAQEVASMLNANKKEIYNVNNNI